MPFETPSPATSGYASSDPAAQLDAPTCRVLRNGRNCLIMGIDPSPGPKSSLCSGTERTRPAEAGLKRSRTNRFAPVGRQRSVLGRAAAVVLFAWSVASCSATTPAPTKTTASATATSGDLVCTSEAALAGRISEFLDAYNAGKSGIADQFFAPAPDFQWYSEPPNRLHDAAYDRSTLGADLAQRHAEGDHLTLERVSLSGDPVGGIGNFGFLVVRGSTPLSSKGAIDCATRRFIVFSLGPNPGPD